MPGLRPIPLVFYRLSNSAEPVREWLDDLPREDQRVVGRDLAKVQFGWPVGMPVCRSLGSGLWEVRSSLPSKREARVLFCFHGETIVALHAFIKKSQKTPDAELEAARRRQKDVAK
jgi:phage-related protein